MRNMLLGFAATLTIAAFTAAPAQAQSWAGGGSSSGSGVRVHRGAPPGFQGEFSRGDRDGRHHGRHDQGFPNWVDGNSRLSDRDRIDDMGWGWNDGTWALYNNRTFEPDSYNDWWHERPWRAYPRWMASGSCDRKWWGGGKWRCTW